MKKITLIKPIVLNGEVVVRLSSDVRLYKTELVLFDDGEMYVYYNDEDNNFSRKKILNEDKKLIWQKAQQQHTEK